MHPSLQSKRSIEKLEKCQSIFSAEVLFNFSVLSESVLYYISQFAGNKPTDDSQQTALDIKSKSASTQQEQNVLTHRRVRRILMPLHLDSCQRAIWDPYQYPIKRRKIT